MAFAVLGEEENPKTASMVGSDVTFGELDEDALSPHVVDSACNQKHVCSMSDVYAVARSAQRTAAPSSRCHELQPGRRSTTTSLRSIVRTW